MPHGPRPTYQQALRAVGRYLDHHVYRRVLVTEVADGYIVRAFPGLQSNLKAEGLALPMSDLLALLAGQEQSRGVPTGDVKMPPLCPTGYEDFFRSLGHDLDTAGASRVSLVETRHGILATYTVEGTGGPERAQMFYDPPGIDELLTRGYRRRGTTTGA